MLRGVARRSKCRCRKKCKIGEMTAALQVRSAAQGVEALADAVSVQEV